LGLGCTTGRCEVDRGGKLSDDAGVRIVVVDVATPVSGEMGVPHPCINSTKQMAKPCAATTEQTNHDVDLFISLLAALIIIRSSSS
jgi:hypothetical protein